MWIQTQNKQRIINSDRVTEIFIDKTGTKICTNIIGYTKPIIFGEYKDRDTCLNILDHLSIGMGSNLPGIPMPLGGEVEDWTKGIEDIAAINIAKSFRR